MNKQLNDLINKQIDEVNKAYPRKKDEEFTNKLKEVARKVRV